MRQQKEIAALEALVSNVAPPAIKPCRTPWEMYVERVLAVVRDNVGTHKFSIEFNDEDNHFWLAAEYLMGSDFFACIGDDSRRAVTARRWAKLPADAAATAMIEAGKALVAELDADLKTIRGAFARA